jgi:DNA-binding protein WhiA
MNEGHLASANAVRVAEAVAETVPAIRAALAQLGASAPEPFVLAGQLRIAYPDVSLAELGRLADPPLTKNAIAARLRKLLALAARAEGMHR